MPCLEGLVKKAAVSMTFEKISTVDRFLLAPLYVELEENGIILTIDTQTTIANRRANI